MYAYMLYAQFELIEAAHNARVEERKKGEMQVRHITCYIYDICIHTHIRHYSPYGLYMSMCLYVYMPIVLLYNSTSPTLSRT
jgi:hypothetical protein